MRKEDKSIELYVCDMCHKTYGKGWSDEESKKEATEIFGKPPEEWNGGSRIVCDDCFEKINPNKHKEILEKIKEEI